LPSVGSLSIPEPLPEAGSFPAGCRIPSPVLADTGTQMVSPPILQQDIVLCELLLDSGRVCSGLSILLIATIIGTFAAFAW
jgi:hypothetical protein